MDEALLDLDNANNDKELFDAASKIVCYPKKPGDREMDSSFILHAPLEICARYFLLPLVDDEHVLGARKQIRNTAKKYFEFENADMPRVRSNYGEFSVFGVNVNKWATTLMFASHATILLSMQNVLGETNSSIDFVLWNMSDGIDSDNQAQMGWNKTSLETKDLSSEILQHPGHWFIENVGNIEHVDGDSASIRNGVETVEASGLILPIVETINSIATFSDRADYELPFKSLMRVAALSMLIEDEEHSKYGWSHCLTIPHAIYSLVSFANNKSEMLQAATTHVASFRSLMGEEKIVAEQFEEYFEGDEVSVFAEHYVRITEIISQACINEDAHLVKYVYTCFDMMKRDPQYSKLYIAAAARLLAIWQD